jgi:PilZ domain-containing protein
MDKRRHPRYAVEYAGSFWGNGMNNQGRILNISTSGCRGSSEGVIRRDALLRVLIDVPRFLAPIQVDPAIICWSSRNEFGLEFVGISFDDQQRLHELLLAIKAAQPPCYRVTR